MNPFAELFAADRGAERIARRLARSGLCSRRDAERWIAAGRVRVDGRTLDHPAVTVDASSRILVDGKPVPPIERPRLWRYHKPAGRITSTSDPQGRRTVFADLPADLPRVMTVGRLDLASEGLLLLTNDGGLARLLELPSTGWVRRYRVRVHGRPEPARLDAIARGVTIEGITYGPADISLDHQGPSNAWLTVGLREGRNREVRRLLEHVDLAVNRLIRVSYGPFQLGTLPAAAVSEVRQRVLREQLGAGRPQDRDADRRRKPARR